jgi:diguanylate cyclase (GGDEF)-like protein
VKLVGLYLRNLLAVLVAIMAVMLIVQVVLFDHSSRAIQALGESSLNEQLDEQLATRAEAMALVLASNVAAPLLRYDMMGIYEVLLPAASRDAVDKVLLLDTDGRIVHDATHEVSSYGVSIASFAPDVDPMLTKPQRLRRDDSYACVMPVFAGTELIGQVYVTLTRSNVAAQLQRLNERFNEIARERRDINLLVTSVFVVLLTAFGVVLSILAARRMAHPIVRLVNNTKSVARGDYNVNVDVRRGDEIGELADAFRHMSSELAAREERISSLAFSDVLTGLPNRTAFTEAVSDYLKEGRCKHAAVLFMDLDEFKRVNDTLGHEAGDRMLRQLGQRLLESISRRGFAQLSFEGHSIAPLARWGGDEFSLFLEGVDNIEAATRLARDILTELREPVSIGSIDIVGGASIGIALYPSDGREINDLLGLADVAMYHAKESAQARIAAYAPAMRESSTARLTLEADLRQAISRGQLALLYEPIYDALSESLCGVEAHLVWRHPKRGLLAPEAFIALAESMEIAGDIVEWMINNAVDQFVQRMEAGELETELTVDLVSLRIASERLVECLAGALERAGIDSSRLIVEITEPRLFHNVLNAAPLLSDVRRLGVQVWVDGFGSGYAAINRLRRMPLDGMKLDRSLVDGIEKSAADRSLSGAVIALAHSLGLRVGADGVTTASQLDYLRRNGCDTVQGAHFGASMEADAMSRALG